MLIIGLEIKIVNILKLGEEYKNELRIWRNQNFVRYNMFNQNKITEEEHEKFIEDLASRTDKYLFIAFINNKPFGVLNYTYYKEENDVEFGYYLINPSDVNGGLGIVLEYMLLEHAFNNIGVDKVFARTLAFNSKTINIHKKFGFHLEKISKKMIDLDKMEDVYYQSILRDDWNKKKREIKTLIEVICPLRNVKIII